MREILFRGKRKDTGEWVYGNLIFMNPHPNGYDKPQAVIMPPTTYIAHGDIWGDFWFVDPETVGRWTGLVDKNEKKIFEGDIVRHIYTEENQLVEWRNDSCGFEPYSDSVENCGHCGGGMIPCHSEIIGNIYDNHELLEDKK